MGVALLDVALLITLMQGAWCRSWSITLPGSIAGVSGSCVTVPCRFEVPDDQEGNVLNCSDGGVWKKTKHYGPAVFTARNPQTSQIKGKIDGDVTKKNCTTTFQSVSSTDSDMFFFRMDCAEPLKFSFPEGVNISISADPSPPRMTPMTPVSEGAQVKLQCSVPVPCFSLPPSISWQLPDGSRQEQTQIQQNSDGLKTLTSTLTFTASSSLHNQHVSCSVTYPLTAGGSTEPSVAAQRLHVQYAPKITVATVSSSGPVSEKRIVTLNCSSDANPPVRNFTWYRIESGKSLKTAEGDVLFLKVKQKDGGVYVCEARTPLGSQRSRPVLLEVLDPAGSSDSPVLVLYVLCGLMLLLHLLTAAVVVHRNQSLSRRLKEMELKAEQPYADLRTVASVYDQLQLRPKAASTSDYENFEEAASKRRGDRREPGGRAV
ncbi:uncharacterized protein V6R79_014378 [Siganus canaliculatus]